MRRSFFSSVFTLVGTTIGAGVFALPNLFARMGIWQTSLCFWSLALLVAVIGFAASYMRGARSVLTGASYVRLRDR